MDEFETRRDRVLRGVMAFATFLIGPSLVLAALVQWTFMTRVDEPHVVVGAGYPLIMILVAVFAIVAGRRQRIDWDSIMTTVLLGAMLPSVCLWLFTELLPTAANLALGGFLTAALFGEVRRNAWPLVRRSQS